MDNFTLFDSHNDALLLFYNINTPICILLNLLAIYLIVLKSSLEMGAYRWYLLHYQIWVSAHDIFQIYTGLLWALSVSTIALFFYRHQCIVEEQYKMSRKNVISCILLLLFVLTSLHVISFQLSEVDPSLWPELLRKVTIPFMLLFVPSLIIRIRVFDGHLGLQILNDILTMMISTYGPVATIFLVFFNYPYREFLSGKLKEFSNCKCVCYCYCVRGTKGDVGWLTHSPPISLIAPGSVLYTTHSRMLHIRIKTLNDL
uniref:G_PROTEIN_RECEP_F2_4 domain-containing protein n=1 Tax=Heterorhabditis bacteriophora TaxID=37862 RepID=A0A1I7W9A6_HETBA